MEQTQVGIIESIEYIEDNKKFNDIKYKEIINSLIIVKQIEVLNNDIELNKQYKFYMNDG